MDLDQLQAFDRIVREGSFSKAAWSLGIAQATISHRMQTLEAEVGGPLFERAGRSVRLSARGQGFLAYARRALRVLAEGVEMARWSAEGRAGRLAFGCLRSLTAGLAAPALTAFYTTQPEVQIVAREGAQTELIEMLWDGVIEFAVVAWPALEPHLADLTPIVQFREPVPLVVAPGHVLARRRSVRVADLLKHSDPFLLLRWWQSTPPALTALTEQTPRLADVPLETGRLWLYGGRATGFFNQAAVRADLEQGRLHAVTVQGFQPLFRPSAVVRLARAQALSPAAERLVVELRAQARLLGWRETRGGASA